MCATNYIMKINRPDSSARIVVDGFLATAYKVIASAVKGKAIVSEKGRRVG